jgi:hypothetical protein
MAWARGGAVYIRATYIGDKKVCGGIVIKENTFTNNLVWLKNTGAAISIHCT